MVRIITSSFLALSLITASCGTDQIALQESPVYGQDQKDLYDSDKEEDGTKEPETSFTAPSPTTSKGSTSSVVNDKPDSPQVLAKDLLNLLRIEPETRQGYDRSLFNHWTDDNNNGCNTRHEVLKRDSLTPAQIDPFRCFVTAGDWYSPYDDTLHTDPSNLDVDHVVALAEAWDSGAWSWDEARRQAFANDLSDSRSLRAVTSSANRAKSDLDPAQWLPPNKNFICVYIADWVAVKYHWDLSVDTREHEALSSLLDNECSQTLVPVWGSVRTNTSLPTGTPLGSTKPHTTPAPPINPDDVYFANCAQARKANAAPIKKGDPGYREQLDRDLDGVACE